MALGDPTDHGVDDDAAIPLLHTELEAVIEACEKQAWIYDKMAEAVAQGHIEEGDNEWTYEQWATFYKARCRRWKELDALEEAEIDKRTVT
jgi:hypothetical protein